MLGIKKLGSVKKLARKVKVNIGNGDAKSPQYECLLEDSGRTCGAAGKRGGTFAVYVGNEREKFVVPTAYLSHPLLKIVLEKAHEEYGFGLVVPCSAVTFRKVMHAVDSGTNVGFFFGELVEDIDGEFVT